MCPLLAQQHDNHYRLSICQDFVCVCVRAPALVGVGGGLYDQ
jgi:hypothetical protein